MKNLKIHAAWTLVITFSLSIIYEIWRSTAMSGTSQFDNMQAFGELFPLYIVGALMIFVLFKGYRWASWAVVASRYLGLRGEHIAASGFILLGITHGISMAAIGFDHFIIEKGATVIMPMIPAFILILWCSLFPKWLRVAIFLTISVFVYQYIRVINGGTFYALPLNLGYVGWHVVEISWAVYLFKDWQKQKAL